MVMNKIYKRNDIIFLTFNVIFKLKELSTFSGDFPRHIKRWWFSEMFMFSINYQTERLANMCWSKTCIKNLKIVLVTKIQSGRGFIMIEFLKLRIKSQTNIDVMKNTDKRFNQLPYTIVPVILQKENNLNSYFNSLFNHNEHVHFIFLLLRTWKLNAMSLLIDIHKNDIK